jgi:N-acylneuraminate cytidylyltransferase
MNKLKDLKMDNKDLKILGIIGARSGSKGVPEKNIRPLGGKPLMAWVIEAAKASRYLNRLIVSTDSASYAEIAKAWGAEVPFLRPPELAADLSAEFEYVKHVLRELKIREGYEPDLVVRLHPTLPFQETEDIDLAIEKLLQDPTADSAVVVAEARQHPVKALKLIADGKDGHYLVTYHTGSGQDVTPLPRQNYERAYFRANLIVSRIETIQKHGSLTGDKVRAHVIPTERAVDIDTELDFFIVEQLLKKFGKI